MVRKRSVELHEERYWHVPRFGLLPLVGLLACGFLAWANFLGIVELWGLLGLGGLGVSDLVSFSQLAIIPSFFAGWFLVAGFFVSLAALVKGGYGKLKSVSKDGLLFGLLVGLLGGLVGGLVGGLIEEFS